MLPGFETVGFSAACTDEGGHMLRRVRNNVIVLFWVSPLEAAICWIMSRALRLPWTWVIRSTHLQVTGEEICRPSWGQDSRLWLFLPGAPLCLLLKAPLGGDVAGAEPHFGNPEEV